MNMGLLLNRVKANTSTTGTGAVTPGAAYSAAYQTWSGAGAISGYSYDYLIEDGINSWELGTGVYNGTTITRPGPGTDLNFASSSGSLLSLSGGATISSVAGKNTMNPNSNPLVNIPPMPLLSGFTTLNATGTRAVTEYPGNGFIVSDTSTSASLQIHGAYKTHGLSTPYRVAIPLMSTGVSVNYICPTVGWRDSSSGKLTTIAPFASLGTWEYHTYNSATSRAGSAVPSAGSSPINSNWHLYNMGWIGLRDDGTNVYYEYSIDGCKDNFMIIHQATKSGSFLTTYDQIFLGMFGQASAYNWKVTYRGYDVNGLTRTY